MSIMTTTKYIDNFVGDSGSGGVSGLVPAPAAGDASAGKFLKADGTWAVAGGGLSLVSYNKDNGSVTTAASATSDIILANGTGTVTLTKTSIKVEFGVNVDMNNGSESTRGLFQLLVDGVVRDGADIRALTIGTGRNIYKVNLGCVVQGLTVGNHTVKVTFSNQSPTVSIFTNPYTGIETPTILQVWEF